MEGLPVIQHNRQLTGEGHAGLADFSIVATRFTNTQLSARSSTNLKPAVVCSALVSSRFLCANGIE
jgi:hypothetical protein